MRDLSLAEDQASTVVMWHCLLCSSLLVMSTHRLPDISHIKLQNRERALLLQYSRSDPDGCFLFHAYVSLIDHKIRDFIARQLVSAQRWGGCSVFTVRDMLLVGVQPLQDRIEIIFAIMDKTDNSADLNNSCPFSTGSKGGILKSNTMPKITEGEGTLWRMGMMR